MRKFNYEMLEIEDLYVNPENYRYVKEAKDEIGAICKMFKVNVGDSPKEMLNLANDIILDGLNPFEMPIVCFNDEIEKYIVYDGNRRITCLKLMTQYKNNEKILKEIPSVAEIYKLNYEEDTIIQCVVFEKAEDAKQCLKKIHNDINNGIGRKQWDSQAKMKANAAEGNKSKTYAVIEFLRKNKNTNKSLLDKMDSNRWVSKLERVVGFSLFKKTYNIQFDNNGNMSYLDTEEQVLKMLSKLVDDIIENPATGKFRHADEFEKYTEELSDEYKSQIKDNEKKREQSTSSRKNKSKIAVEKNIEEKDNETGIGEPKVIPRKHAKSKAALVLSKNYDYSAYECLNEKGKEILIELESLNVKQYPVAAAALSRCLIEYTLKLWLDEQNGEFDSSKLPTCYSGCINLLRNKKILDNKEHSVLHTTVNKKEFITLLNTWIHADTEACVSETPLISGWKNIRLLIEKYIETHKNKE